uniref:Uncharacterized protein n=1 Tax=Vespula pensylvanica TaxID=30213 RepID=A0A834UES6_VESPE|nr:hypothetical protein H0235_003545 [Vespula pensylvanica]
MVGQFREFDSSPHPLGLASPSWSAFKMFSRYSECVEMNDRKVAVSSVEKRGGEGEERAPSPSYDLSWRTTNEKGMEHDEPK